MEHSHAANRPDEFRDRRLSEAEAQNTFEVVFDNEAVHRRKSSLAPGTGTGPQRPRHMRKPTNCFVHSLFEPHRDATALQATHSPPPDSDYAIAATPSYEGLKSDRVTDKNPDAGLYHNGDDVIQEEKGTGAGAVAVTGVEPAVQSRLLTKKQISDMAFGIRELAKKLAHIRIKMNVRNVFILAKAHDETLIGKTREVAEWLLQQDVNYRIYVENTLQENKIFDYKGLVEDNESYKHRLRFWTVELCQQRPQTWDIVLALGGDGTVLYASWLFQHVVPPVLAFSLGSLGFLTKFDYGSFPQVLTKAFNEGITVSLRLRFEATVMRSQKREKCGGTAPRDLVEELIGEESEDCHTHFPDGTYNILNEVVLDRGPNPTMSSIEIFGDDEHYTSVQADGICIATPTGSTAYNLAAGGSLCHPDNPVILLTAICAHTLSFRPIVLPDTIVLRAGVPYDARTSSWASFDGRERVELKPGDYVTVSASRFPFPSVLPVERRGKDWIDSISRTLNWNSRQRQKAFKEWEKEEK
ncbi:Inorganic polyphosphate/ATP-NAD kinase predicted [Lasiodiplodia theobromae]|uniref:Inorganic polyphosphate/ATP-NAD kinase predicted n=1 Tax=Lasiodiplodia theobromae TaxID=45133 RepID=A0A5N5DUE5_9PEZI|nr:Nad kinase ATP nad kinase [Lasiodiplodia theobromae]KAB2581377.1 putative kinase [Lasiodiplodia theobromae]KAF4539832.1 Nad kinase ATP nad kinase [Lasiodiplodia theobromae]KAF9629550.1 Inorganic polyphosphate/ATP-NAD kinase predicted [Lasiodiplodia theobromae]